MDSPQKGKNDYTASDVRVCNVCGLVKKTTDFALMKHAKQKQQDCCRVCAFMTQHNLVGWRHCECCGQDKPNIAFPKQHSRLKRCRPCTNQAVTVAELV